jgi:hypothetical protein
MLYVQGSNHVGIVLSCCLVFWFPALTNMRHVDVLLLRNSLCNSHTTLLCLLILSLWMFEWGHANRRCGHMSIDCVLHIVQLMSGYRFGNIMFFLALPIYWYVLNFSNCVICEFVTCLFSQKSLESFGLRSSLLTHLLIFICFFAVSFCYFNSCLSRNFW